MLPFLFSADYAINERYGNFRELMIIRPSSHLRPPLLLVFLVALGLPCAGWRIPELSRPHRPKPSLRVVLENHHKGCSNHLKLCSDLAAVVPTPSALLAPVWYLGDSPMVSARQSSPQSNVCSCLSDTRYTT